MRIVVPKDPRWTKIYTDDGADITQELGVAEVKIVVTVEGARALLTCELFQLDAEIDYKNVAAKVLYKVPDSCKSTFPPETD